MEVHGNLNMRGNALQNAALAVDENFPDAPTPGRLTFIDRVLHLCTELAGGLPVWIPITQQLTLKRATITEAAMEWTVSHEFNSNAVLVQVYDQYGKWLIPDAIISDTVNSVTVRFSMPMIGTVIIQSGNTEGSTPPLVAFTESFTDSATWVVNHQLGYNPIITVIVGGNIVQPQSIVQSVENMQTTITFSTAQSGTVRCV